MRIHPLNFHHVTQLPNDPLMFVKKSDKQCREFEHALLSLRTYRIFPYGTRNVCVCSCFSTFFWGSYLFIIISRTTRMYTKFFFLRSPDARLMSLTKRIKGSATYLQHVCECLVFVKLNVNYQFISTSDR